MTEQQFEPAFPILDDCNGLGLALRDAGMSLRDYFAAKIISGMIASHDPDKYWVPSEVAKAAYLTADAMLKARDL